MNLDMYVVGALVCGLIAIIYGVINISWIMKLDQGNEKMQQISKAIQEGAAAYPQPSVQDHRSRRRYPRGFDIRLPRLGRPASASSSAHLVPRLPASSA